MKNFTCINNMNIRQCTRVSPILYFFTSFNIIQKYVTCDNILTIVIHIFQHLIYLTLVSDLYGLMRHILCLIFIASHCNMTMQLVQY